MNNKLLGIVVSFIYIFALIGISSLLSKKNHLSNEGSRKLIHIGVSNWWIIAMYYFDDRLWASIIPAVFIVINFISYKLNIFKAMERDGGKNDLGTVYFPISLLILAMMSFSSFSHPYVGGLGILIMGYGDGFAAVLGKSFGKKTYMVLGNKKSFVGSATMFAVSFLVSLIVLNNFSPDYLIQKSIILALFATVVEGASPYGLDNLTVPISVSLLYQIIYF